MIQTLRRTALAGTELANAKASTIRSKLLKIGAVVRTSVRRIVLQLSSAYPLKELFQMVVSRLTTRQTQLE